MEEDIGDRRVNRAAAFRFDLLIDDQGPLHRRLRLVSKGTCRSKTPNYILIRLLLT